MNERQLWDDYQEEIRTIYELYEGTLDDSELDRRLSRARLDFNEAVDELFFADPDGESRHTQRLPVGANIGERNEQ